MPPADADPLARARALLASDDPGEVAEAERLLLGLLAGEPRARALAAAAYDRGRLLRGLPQKFGTQWVTREGRAELWAVDPGTTDSERAKWGLPPLVELRQNRFETEE